MSDLNKIQIIGRLTKDPEIKIVGSAGTSVCKVSIANNRTYGQAGQKKEEVHFFNCECWGARAETLAKYTKKGSQLAISGRLAFKSWQDGSGNKRSDVSIIIEEFQFLSKAEGSTSQAVPTPDDYPDDDIPF